MNHLQLSVSAVKGTRVLKPVLHVKVRWNYKGQKSKGEIAGIVKAHSERVVAT